ncbi:MAG: tRNA (adenosine(37)-N6)-dimethylallyltransferase MiaA [Bacteroidetes bacterium]|nr:tRNA (adenosine(37)-N6)-dimethylallyltransferase MiaA [Bacteroidota bacterium]
MNAFDSILVIGPTASGKTALAVALAHAFQSEIVSLDSRQFYKGLDIGSGKDLKEYLFQNQPIPYHLIDVIGLDEEINLSRFAELVNQVKSDLSHKGINPILVGGSGFYIEHILHSFEYRLGDNSNALRAQLESLSDEELQIRLGANPELKPFNRYKAIRRIEDRESTQEKAQFSPFKPLILGINPPTAVRWNRIQQRLKQRIAEGMIQETEALLQNGISPERLIRLGLEYKYCTLLLQGKLNQTEFEEQLFFEIRRFSKRQMTYFRKLERDGYSINWLPWSDDSHEMHSFAIQFIKNKWQAADMFVPNAKDAE